jgi:hypothetical protein
LAIGSAYSTSLKEKGNPFLAIRVFHVKLNRYACNGILKENKMDNRPGCLSGLLKLFFIDAIFDWLQGRFGFGRGCSCSGCGCGVILFIIFVGLICSVLSGTNWSNFGF